MRDPKRIHEFCQKLEEYWTQNPDLRFGQIFENLKKRYDIVDAFYIEDDKMVEMIDGLTKNINTNRCVCCGREIPEGSMVCKICQEN